MAAVPPRLASTIVLLAERAAPEGFAVLMMKRHSKARFMPSLHAFPGGCVEPEDALSGPRLTLQRAALRELAEETACVLCGDGSVVTGGEVRPDPSDPSDPSAAADPAALLVPFAHWVTPESEPCRYDTAFFAAAVPPETPAVAQLRRQESEVSSLVWISPREALRRHEHAETLFSLAPVTYLLLHAMAQYRNAADVLDVWKKCREAPTVVHPRIQYDETGAIQSIHVPERYVTVGALDAGLYQYPNPSMKRRERYTELIVGDVSRTSNVKKLREGTVF